MEDTIALSSRIRLARNYEDFAFPSRMNQELAQSVLDRTMQSLQAAPDLGVPHMVRMADLSQLAREELVEQHRISPELARRDEGALVELLEGSVYVMINEEDHLRIQAILPGLSLGEALEKANRTDDALERGGYAFDPRYGYLTACPTNAGTGMRASVMLHLPALTLLSQIGPIIRSVSRIGLTVRGIYGEGSQANGNMYQLSNQVTLGRNESEILHALGEAALQVMQRERDARKLMLERNRIGLEDRLLRSYGILSNARKMSLREFMQRMSDVRLAMDLSLLPLQADTLDALLLDAQPAALQRRAGEELSAEEQNVQRANLVREELQAVG